MTAEVLAPLLTSQYFANNGTFLAGGQLFSYQAGTNTPVATYTDSTGVTQNTNPIILNARGEASVWITPNVAYKFVLEDSAGNTIWTRDQVTSSQLLTLFGGVDQGVSNAYILNFAATFSSLINGIVIYFVPSNSNTGPSTLTVNGLATVPIVNINGSPLGANQIVAGVMTEVVYYQGVWQLLSIGGLSGVTIGTFGAEVPLASSATVDLGSAPAHTVLITGTTPITSFGSSASIAAPYYFLRFSGATALIYNALSMMLPGNASIITTAGDSAIAQYLGGGVWRVAFYQYSAGNTATAKIKPADTQIISSSTLTPDPDLQSNNLGVGRYSYELYLLFDSPIATAGFQFTNDGTAIDSRGVVPGLTYGSINASAYGPKSESFYGSTVTYSTLSIAANSNETLYKGSLLVGTPGTFGIAWAQAVSSASPTTLRAGSYLSLSLLNTGTSSNLVQHVYTTPGSFTEIIPTGYNTLTLEVWGGSGGGGARFISGVNGAGGGGGGSGGYCLSSIVVTGLGGDTLNFTVGFAGVVAFSPGGTSSVSSGTLAITTMSGGGGFLGGNATGINSPGAGALGGAASGGTVTNTTGNPGANGQPNTGNGAGGQGGFGITGINGGGLQGGHGAGLNTFPSGSNGGNGLIVFSYSP
jgi:hypothetical protein